MRIFKEVRATIRMIYTIICDTAAFFIVFLSFVLSFALAWQALHDGRFIEGFMDMYFLIMGEYGSFGEEFTVFYEHPDNRIFFLVATLFLQLVLMNMVIALMGESYGTQSSKEAIEDTHEKLEIINKMQRFALWPRIKQIIATDSIVDYDNIDPEYKYLHSIKLLFEQQQKNQPMHQKIKDLKASV